MWLAGRRLWLAPLFSLLCVIPLTNGLHESDVGVVDWHKRLIGVPLAGSSSTAPTFYHVNGTSLVFTATGNNVLAALHPDNGSVGQYNTILFCEKLIWFLLIAWRYLFDPEDRIAGFYNHDNGLFRSFLLRPLFC
jgi:ER membrane protein complex subunit 1